jgi:peptidase A4-like protein
MHKAVTAVAAAIALAVVVPTVAAGAPAQALRHAPNHKLTNSTSSNWSGYAATGSRFTSISASWTQPTAVCSGTSYSSFWVGLDGDTSNTVEQTGSSADCSSAGVPSYYAWYEMYPKYPAGLSGTVKPGDSFAASVTTDGAGRFTLTIADSTEHWTFKTTQRLKSAALASAEVIAEAPSSRSGVLPLTNFGTVNFSGSTANGASLSTFHPDRIDMASGSTVKAQTGSISSNGSFSVTWKHS